ncbi:MAG: hypothetical protein LBO72_09555 [Helicobacteraceae bacterium]|jgi:DNA repair protein RadA/Sms|nr:hypothetical protein [Helicobacteraceae bacterium]
MELFNANIERSLLATALWDQTAAGRLDCDFGTLAGMIESRHFYIAQHRAIFAAMERLYKKNVPIAEEFVKSELGDKYDEDKMLDILATSPLSAPAPYCAQLVELYKKREIVALASETRSLASETEADDAIAEIKRKLDQIEASGAQSTKAKSFDELAKDEAIKKPIEKFPLGVGFLNDTFRGGFEVGQLVLIGGEPEAGKTMLTMQIIKHICQTSPVLFFCFEFTTRKLVQAQKEIEGDNFKAPNLHIIDDGYDIAQIEREIRIWAKRGAKVFAIDSQIRVENNAAKNATVEERETEKFSRLAKLAHRLSLLIIFIIQTSKSDTASGVYAPMKSKNAAHEASVIIYIKRVKDKNGENTHKRKIMLVKNKQNGIHFESEVNFNPATKRFTRPYAASEYKTPSGVDIPVILED